jgi:DNA polymerase/3'-5' exonuclease PolX
MCRGREAPRMEDVEAARTLNVYVDLLDIQGENLWRVRSYHQAAQIITGLSSQ